MLIQVFVVLDIHRLVMSELAFTCEAIQDEFLQITKKSTAKSILSKWKVYLSMSNVPSMISDKLSIASPGIKDNHAAFLKDPINIVRGSWRVVWGFGEWFGE